MMNASERLYNLETPPPAGAWDRIAAALDDVDHRGVLAERSASEVSPLTPGIAELEQSVSPMLRERLLNLEASPPPAVWSSILRELYPANSDIAQPGMDETQLSPVIPMRSRFPAALRYAAAVAVLALIGWLVYPLVRSAPDRIQTVAVVNAPGDPAPAAPAKGAVSAAAAAVADLLTPRGNDLPRPGERVPGESGRNSSASSGTRNRSASGSGIYAAAREIVNRDAVYNDENNAPSLAERYVTLLTPDGSFIRMSKKLGSMICCVTGDEQDTGCKDQLRKLQEQIARSDAQGNVLDMLDLVSSLDDGNKL